MGELYPCRKEGCCEAGPLDNRSIIPTFTSLKKAMVAILAFLYLAVASGVEMNIHYCMGEVSSIEYGAAKKGICDKCGMESKKGCCEDQTTILKIQDSHQLSQLSWAFQLPAMELPAVHDSYSSLIIIERLIMDQPSNGPPPGTVTDIYLKNCVFRI